MKRLYENELIYGRLLSVDQPHLIERYNKALKAFGVGQTKLSQFDIDKTGFSPQVAEELGNYEYLDPNGVNRRFIILTPAQVSLPVVHTQFSNTSTLMYDFFTANMRVINALTIKDVIFGEIEENVSTVNDIEDLLSIQQVEFRVLSADDVIGQANELRRLVDRLKNEPDAWRDDALLDRMVTLSKKVGDIRENQMVPDQVVFRHNAFWTSHFDGTYIFIDEKMTTVISDPNAPGYRRSRPWQVSYLPMDDYDRVFRFLAETKRIDLPRAEWINEAGFLDHRANMVLSALIYKQDPDLKLDLMDPVWLQTWLHKNASIVAEDGRYAFINQVKREMARYGRIDINEVPEEYRFLLVRAKPEHPDAWLTNRLICEYNGPDFVSRYVFNKQAFYDDYEGYSDAFRHYVVETLKDTYLKDKQALRDRLYGLSSTG